MATSSEMYRPSNGDLLVRDGVSHSADIPTETFRNDSFGKRPMSQGGYRFGQLSHNSFFTRHNPHPGRVRHLKGLLDVPICSVNDDGYFANPRYSLNFPPNQFNNTKLTNWKGQIPVSAINVNSQLHPINTVTGLQYFTGLNSYPYREKAIPKIGLVPVTESWRDELKTFTKSLGFQDDAAAAEKACASAPAAGEEQRPRTTMYSQETGRLIPPPSRAMSRGGSRRGRMDQQYVGGNFQHISADPDWDNIILTMLCQILQTEDVNAVQAWLCSSGEREKNHVMSLVKSALAGREEYYKQYPAEYIPDEGKTKLPPIRPGSSAEVNRLVLEEGNKPESPKWQKAWMPSEDSILENGDVNKQEPETKEFVVNSGLNDVFKPMPPQAKRSTTPLHPARRSSPSRLDKPASPEPRLKYTKSPTKDKKEAMWSQNDSLNTF